MMWPELKKAKDLSREIDREINALLRIQNSYGIKEIAKNADVLAENADAARKAAIGAAAANARKAVAELSKEMLRCMESHRKYLLSKSRFYLRHYRGKELK